MKTILAATITAMIALHAPGQIHAESVRAATYLVDHNFQTKHGLIGFSKKISEATGGAVEFQTFTNGALLPARSLLGGIGDGVAQVGFHTTNYTPAELPVIYSLSGMGFKNPDPYILGFAFADWLMHEPEGQADYAKHNVVPVGAFSTPSYQFICGTAPIVTSDDIAGKKLRFPGGQTAALAGVLNFTPVTIPAPDMFMALQNGQIDCATIYLTFLTIDMQLIEVAKSISLVNLPPVFYDPLQLYNADYWASLAPEHKAAIFKISAEAMVDTTIDFHNAQENGLAEARERGIAVVETDDSINSKIEAWVQDGVGGMTEAAAKLGVEDADSLFASFQNYIDKWEGVMSGIEDRTDREALLRAVNENIFADLDPATYGLK